MSTMSQGEAAASTGRDFAAGVASTCPEASERAALASLLTEARRQYARLVEHGEREGLDADTSAAADELLELQSLLVQAIEQRRA
jgi:hypothetical protein